MSNSIIEVNNLSKSYTISHEGRERYTALRDVMAQKAKKIFSLRGSLPRCELTVYPQVRKRYLWDDRIKI